MAYNTDYSLVIIEPKRISILEIIEQLRDKYADAKSAIGDSGEPSESVAWYSHENDMKAFSRQFPEHVFVLDGVGEDGDHLRKYFKNGKMQDAAPVVAYEPFDENKLK